MSTLNKESDPNNQFSVKKFSRSPAAIMMALLLMPGSFSIIGMVVFTENIPNSKVFTLPTLCLSLILISIFFIHRRKTRRRRMTIVTSDGFGS